MTIQHSHREERDIRSITSESSRGRATNPLNGATGNSSASSSGDEEWKNIHTMLSCISGMVEKTKRAISILQQRGGDGSAVVPTHQESTLISDIKRQTEEKIAEFRRNAEDAVNQVKFLFFNKEIRKIFQ